MNKPHERLTRSTFSLPLGEVHALVGGAVNARPLLFLHGFPDHPPTAVPFLEHLAETHRVVAPWLRGYAPSDRRSLRPRHPRRRRRGVGSNGTENRLNSQSNFAPYSVTICYRIS